MTTLEAFRMHSDQIFFAAAFAAATRFGLTEIMGRVKPPRSRWTPDHFTVFLAVLIGAYAGIAMVL
jgi:hypothetical protein